YDRNTEKRNKKYTRKSGNNKGVFNLTREELEYLYVTANKSMIDIGNMAGVSRITIYNKLKECGIPTRSKTDARTIALRKGKILDYKKHDLDENFFKEWSPQMAWVLGLILTDGNVVDRRLVKTTRTVNSFIIHQKDPEILYKV